MLTVETILLRVPHYGHSQECLVPLRENLLNVRQVHFQHKESLVAAPDCGVCREVRTIFSLLGPLKKTGEESLACWQVLALVAIFHSLVLFNCSIQLPDLTLFLCQRPLHR
jgi:hypothetical protein